MIYQDEEKDVTAEEPATTEVKPEDDSPESSED